MSLLVAMWFSSGVVMMYVGFPELTRAERITALPVLEKGKLQVGPDKLFRHLPATQTIEELRLTSILGRPTWLLRTNDDNYHGLFADNGGIMKKITPDDAIVSASIYAYLTDISTVNLSHKAILHVDQWSISSSLNPYRPLHLIELNDLKGTELYVSSVTGQVVRDTSTFERGWNWLGANLHWIYPVQLRQHSAIWHWVVVVLSLSGLVSILTGAIVGVLRIRIRNRYRGKDMSPYKKAMKLHHILGLFILIPLTTYLFSGLMSMNPLGVFNDNISFTSRLSDYHNTPSAVNILNNKGFLSSINHNLVIPPDARELIWHWRNGLPYLYAVSGDGRRQVLVPTEQRSIEVSSVENLQKIMTSHRIKLIETLTDYDHYYYSHHQRWRPLPVMRVRFDDPAATWFHIDLTTGELINQLTQKGRAKRWLFNGLHSLDFNFLISNRPAWDLLIIALISTGFLFSCTAIIVAWRRLRSMILAPKQGTE